MGFDQLPQEAGLALTFLAVIAAYMMLMRILAVLSEGRISTEHGWREAEEKAEQLLADILSPEELQQLRQRGFLEIASHAHPGRVYRIPRHPGLVSVYEQGALVSRLCVGAVEPLPTGDAVLLHKLMIEGAEEEYLRRANPIRPPYPYLF